MTPSFSQDWLARAGDFAQAAVHSPIAWTCVLLVGLLVLTAGERLLRPAVGFACTLTGAWLGLITAPQVAQASTPGVLIVGSLVGGGAGLALGMLLLRFAMTAAGSAVFACLGVLLAGVYLQSHPEAWTITSHPVAELRAEVAEAGAAILSGEDRAAVLQSTAGEARDYARDAWSSLPANSRVVLAGGALLGAALGLMLGAFAPRKAAAGVTALLGAGLSIAGGVGLIAVMGWAHEPWERVSPTVALIIWCVLAAVGAAVQVSGQSSTRRAPAPA